MVFTKLLLSTKTVAANCITRIIHFDSINSPGLEYSQEKEKMLFFFVCFILRVQVIDHNFSCFVK